MAPDPPTWPQVLEAPNSGELLPRARRCRVCIVVLLVGWAVVEALRSLADKALTSVGFNDWVERGGVGRAMERTKYDASDVPATIVYWAVWLLTLEGSNPSPPPERHEAAPVPRR